MLHRFFRRDYYLAGDAISPVADRMHSPRFFFVEAMQDSTVLILLAAAFVSITLGIIVCAADLGQSCPRKPLWQGPIDLGPAEDMQPDCMEWLDGAAIIFACLLIGFITASNETSKEEQFRVLQDKQQDSAVTVCRNGIEVNTWGSGLGVWILGFGF